MHTADHVRQGFDGVTTEVLAGGTVLTALALVTLVFAARGEERAPLMAAVVGLWAAAGILASHVAPHWSALSDSYPEIGADALSWLVMLLEVGAGLALGAAGLRRLRMAHRGYA